MMWWVPLLALIIGFLIGKFMFDMALTAKKKSAEAQIEQAKQEAKKIMEQAEYKSQKMLEKSEKDMESRQKKVDQYEARLAQKEEKLDQKMEKLEVRKEEMSVKKQEIEKVLESHKTKLSEIAGMTPAAAKEQLFGQIEEEYSADIKKFINKFKMVKEEEAKEEAGKIIAKILPRVAQEGLSEHLVTMVDLPTEDMKGKIIWREGRNISHFEKVTGVEVTIDDTPLTIKLSCYDPELRFLAAETMKILVKDGRINPVYIEKLYEETKWNIQELFMKKGKEALAKLNLPMMKPAIVEYIGRFHLRYSYGQNLLLHSIEVARMAELIANELGLDAELAKKAGLLHDIGKIDAGNGEAHTKVGAELLRKHKMHEVLINTAEGHHFDVELMTPVSRVATAADIISASRPGARFDTKNMFVERMRSLENLVLNIPGVQKAYIMQAGREIMTFFNPEEVNDAQVEKIIKDIGDKIEDQLDYPGAIRIVGIKEKKAIYQLR